MKRYNYIATLLLSGIIGFSGCTDNFDSDNSIKGAFNEEAQELDYQKYSMPLQVIQSGIYFQYNWGDGLNWPWQLTQSLQHDMFSGYSMTKQPNLMIKIQCTVLTPDGLMPHGITRINTFFLLPIKRS